MILIRKDLVRMFLQMEEMMYLAALLLSSPVEFTGHSLVRLGS
jgi:hypothetical protein